MLTESTEMTTETPTESPLLIPILKMVEDNFTAQEEHKTDIRKLHSDLKAKDLVYQESSDKHKASRNESREVIEKLVILEMKALEELEAVNLLLSDKKESLDTLVGIGKMKMRILESLSNDVGHRRGENMSRDVVTTHGKGSACRALSSAVKNFDGKKRDYATVNLFVTAITDWLEEEGETSNATLLKLIRSKLESSASATFTRAMENSEFHDLASWAAWFLKYYTRDNNSTVARKALEKATQVGLRLKDVTAYFNHLEILKDQILDHPMRHVQYQERFVSGVDPDIASALEIKYQDRLDDLRELDGSASVVSDRWLLAHAVTLETNKPKPSKPWKSSTPWTPVVGAISAEVPEYALVRPIDDKAREWCTKHGHCFWCREAGHRANVCPTLAKHLLDRPSPLSTQVCYPTPFSPPLLVTSRPIREVKEGSRVSNKIIPGVSFASVTRLATYSSLPDPIEPIVSMDKAGVKYGGVATAPVMVQVPNEADIAHVKEVSFASVTRVKQFDKLKSPDSILGNDDEDLKILLKASFNSSLPDLCLPTVSMEEADVKYGGVATAPVMVQVPNEADIAHAKDDVASLTCDPASSSLSGSISTSNLNLEEFVRNSAMISIPGSLPAISSSLELADANCGGLATVPGYVRSLTDPVSAQFHDLPPLIGDEVVDEEGANSPFVEDITSSEPRLYQNESPSGGNALLERIQPSLLSPISSAIKEEVIDIDTTPMPVFSDPSDRKMFNCTLKDVGSENIPTSYHRAVMFLDGGSDGNLMSEEFALNSGVSTYTVPSRTVTAFEGSTIVIDRECQAVFRLGDFYKTIAFSVCPIGTPGVDIILGVPFFQIVRVINEDWKNHKFKFVSRSGTTHTWHGRANKYRPNNEPLVYMVGVNNVLSTNTDVWSVNIMDLIDKYQFPIDTRDDDGITVNTGSSLQKFLDSEFAVSSCFVSNISSLPIPETKSNSQLSAEFLDSLEPEIAAVLRPFLDSVLSDPPKFDEIPCRPEDMEIPLKPDSKIPNPGLRRFSDAENAAIKVKLIELLERGFIRPSKSEFGANLLFSRKKDGSLRMCIDYRSTNAATVKDRTPLPSHVELRESIKGSKFLSKFDIRDAFHMIRISSADCHKTAFKTKWGSFEYTVCPFGLANSPATFMRLMNRVFFDLMGVCLIFYVDDILVYSSTYEQHLIDIGKVMQRLQDHNLHVKISKCELAKQELEFCGMQVSSVGFAIQQSQVDAMCLYPDLPLPAITSDVRVSSDRRRKAVAKYVQQFLGSVRFFADFIPWISELALPLYELTSKTCLKEWNVDHQMTIRSIQHALSTAPVLSFFDHSRPETHVHSDASNFAIGGWVSQIDVDGKTHIISYWSRKLIPAETRYTVHEREFLGLHDMIAKFRMYLFGIPFTAHVDHRAMEHLQTQPNLSPRQARWLVYLQEFEFTIEYITGIRNTFADWLSRRPDFIANHCDECHKLLVEKLSPPTASLAWVNAVHATDNTLISSVSADP
jgi:hypothetical protein